MEQKELIPNDKDDFVSFSDGEISWYDTRTNERHQYKIETVRVRLEEKEHEPGVFVIVGIQFWGEHGVLLYSDLKAIAKHEYMFPDEFRFSEVQKSISQEYQVPREKIILEE